MGLEGQVLFNATCRVKQIHWPDITFYDKQWELIESTCFDQETYAPAGNELGKDYVSAFVILSRFLVARIFRVQCKILTTSAVEKHLANLWGEMDRFIRESKAALRVEDGGPLRVTEKSIYMVVNQTLVKDSYIFQAVASSENKGEGLSGHHASEGETLFVADEASGVPDVAYKMAQGWADHMLIIGNPNPCSNFFYQAIEDGDLEESVALENLDGA